MRPDEFGGGMTLIVKTVARLTVGLILLFGIYVILQGYASPGGGFAGGVIIALAFIHLTLAFGKDSVRWHYDRSIPRFVGRLRAPTLMSLAMLAFLAAWLAHGLVALRGGEARPYDPLVMELCHLFIGINVGAGLFTIFVALVGFPVRGEEGR
ncbi:MAG: MnhB domain-containing protein [bacterium]|nr:MnhB domain-containing protein [bacterium]